MQIPGYEVLNAQAERQFFGYREYQHEKDIKNSHIPLVLKRRHSKMSFAISVIRGSVKRNKTTEYKIAAKATAKTLTT